MPNYKYICGGGHNYIERRPVEMPQIYPKCQTCGADFTEVTE